MAHALACANLLLGIKVLRDLAKFGDAADFDPFRHEDVAGVVKPGSVRGDELAGLEHAAVFGDAQLVLLAGISAIAQGE